LQNLLDGCADGRLPAKVVLTVSNKPDAIGLTRATQAGVQTAVVERKTFPDRAAFSAAVFDECRDAVVDLVCLGGYLQLLHVPDDFTHRVMNIHPSLLPAFGGQGMYGE